jgi:hypothetical protein
MVEKKNLKKNIYVYIIPMIHVQQILQKKIFLKEKRSNDFNHNISKF